MLSNIFPFVVKVCCFAHMWPKFTESPEINAQNYKLEGGLCEAITRFTIPLTGCLSLVMNSLLLYSFFLLLR